MQPSTRALIGLFLVLLLSCTAVGYASATGFSDGDSTLSGMELDTANSVQENDSDFPIAGDANGTVPIRVEMYETETATITYGVYGDGQNVRFDATVRDTNDDGIALVTFDPTSFGGSNDGFTAGEGTEIVRTNSK